MFYYAFTLRRTTPVKDSAQAEKTINRYYNYVRYLQKRWTSIHVEINLETKPKKNGKHNVHLHAMVKSPIELSKTDLPRERGLSIDFEECRSKIAWRAYMSKDKLTEQEIYDLIDVYNRGDLSVDSEEYIEELFSDSKLSLPN